MPKLLNIVILGDPFALPNGDVQAVVAGAVADQPVAGQGFYQGRIKLSDATVRTKIYTTIGMASLPIARQQLLREADCVLVLLSKQAAEGWDLNPLDMKWTPEIKRHAPQAYIMVLAMVDCEHPGQYEPARDTFEYVSTMPKHLQRVAFNNRSQIRYAMSQLILTASILKQHHILPDSKRYFQPSKKLSEKCLQATKQFELVVRGFALGCQQGDADKVQRALATKLIDANYQAKMGGGLHLAARAGHAHIVNQLLLAGAEATAVDANQNTAFNLANGEHAEQIKEQLVIFGVKQILERSQDTFALALSHWHQRLNPWLQHDVNAACNNYVSTTIREHFHYLLRLKEGVKHTPRLREMARFDLVLALQCLITVITEQSSDTALAQIQEIFPAIYASLATIQQYRDGNTLLHLVGDDGKLGLMNLPCWSKFSEEALSVAVDAVDVDLVDYLMRQGVDFSQKNKADKTPLHAHDAAAQFPFLRAEFQQFYRDNQPLTIEAYDGWKTENLHRVQGLSSTQLTQLKEVAFESCFSEANITDCINRDNTKELLDERIAVMMHISPVMCLKTFWQWRDHYLQFSLEGYSEKLFSVALILMASYDCREVYNALLILFDEERVDLEADLSVVLQQLEQQDPGLAKAYLNVREKSTSATLAHVLAEELTEADLHALITMGADFTLTNNHNETAYDVVIRERNAGYHNFAKGLIVAEIQQVLERANLDNQQFSIRDTLQQWRADFSFKYQEECKTCVLNAFKQQVKVWLKDDVDASVKAMVSSVNELADKIDKFEILAALVAELQELNHPAVLLGLFHQYKQDENENIRYEAKRILLELIIKAQVQCQGEDKQHFDVTVAVEQQDDKLLRHERVQSLLQALALAIELELNDNAKRICGMLAGINIDECDGEGDDFVEQCFAKDKAGIIFNWVNAEGETLLHIAVRSRDYAFAERLIRYGAQANVKNSAGQTPLAILLEKQKQRVSDWWIELLAIADMKSFCQASQAQFIEDLDSWEDAEDPYKLWIKLYPNIPKRYSNDLEKAHLAFVEDYVKQLLSVNNDAVLMMYCRYWNKESSPILLVIAQACLAAKRDDIVYRIHQELLLENRTLSAANKQQSLFLMAKLLLAGNFISRNGQVLRLDKAAAAPERRETLLSALDLIKQLTLVEPSEVKKLKDDICHAIDKLCNDKNWDNETLIAATEHAAQSNPELAYLFTRMQARLQRTPAMFGPALASIPSDPVKDKNKADNHINMRTK